MISVTDIENLKQYIENSLMKKINPKRICKAKISSGKQCSRVSCNVNNTCKIHTNSTNFIKQKKIVTYHNHLPFEKVDDCPICTN